MNALLLSREDRAAHVIKLCEFAARGLTLDLDDTEDESMGLLKGSYAALASKLSYLMPRSSAQWKPEFERALESSHSMRVQTIEVSRKQAIAGVRGKCMACGRNESNCRYSIDLAGSMEPREWLRGPHQVAGLYASFKKGYEEVYDSEFVNDCMQAGELPEVDKGRFVVGQTCLRKAKLRHLLQTLLLETCYACDRDLEEIEARGESTLEIDEGSLYTVTDERCEEFVKRQDTLELAVADDKRYTPDIPIDIDFWNIIDECRNAIAGGSDCVFDDIISRRANETLSNLHMGGVRGGERGRGHKDEDDDEQSDGDDGQNREDQEDDRDDECGDECGELYAEVCVGGGVFDVDGDKGAANKRRVPRKRSCVIADDDSDEGDGADEGDERVYCVGGHATRSSTKHTKYDVPCVASSSGEGESSRTLVGSRRSNSPSISGMVGMRRAAGILPSRNDALVQLMELQTRLAKSHNNRDAVVCTNAILTMQELMQRVEELRHTAGV